MHWRIAMLMAGNCELQVQPSDMESDTIVINNQVELQSIKKKSAPKKDSKPKNVWEKGSNQRDSDFKASLESFEPPANEFMNDEETVNKSWTPLDLFFLFFNFTVMNFLCEMTNIYAAQSNATNWIPLTPDELKCFVGIIILSSYAKLPSYKLYWEEALDVGHQMVRNAMTRNRFAQILRYIHFSDNTAINLSDKCSKIRPLLDMLQTSCKKYASLTKKVNADESMIPYTGKFGNALKQHMPKKPIRFGYKVWCLNLDGGYLYDFIVYQGKGSRNEFMDKFGLGPSVVLELINSLPAGNFQVYIDNYFVSIDLLKELKKRQIGCTGTMKVNMLQGCPVSDKKEIKKEKKGTLFYGKLQ